MKIKDLVIGEQTDITLVVSAAIAKETKSKKPYLAMEFFDGTSSIKGNYWDWTSGNIPAINTILDVNAQVTEWQGEKQLNIKTMRTNTTKQLAEFAPTSEYNVAETYKAAYALMSDVKDDALRTLALAILEELKVLWITVPGAKSVHHNYIGGTLIHSYNVAVKAKALAELVDGADVDITTVGGMLHDVGKLFTYTVNGVSIERTTNGMLYEHLFIGAEFIGNFAEAHLNMDDPYTYGKVRLLRHIILSHHGALDFGSPVTPQCMEAHIVHHADAIDAICEQVKVASNNAADGSIWTDKIWTLNNNPHITSKYIDGLMRGLVE